MEDGSLVAFVDHLQGGGPFSITLDLDADFSFRNIPIKEHDRVYLKPNVIEVGGAIRVQGLNMAKEFDPLPHIQSKELDLDKIQSNLLYLKNFVLRSGRVDGLADLACLYSPDTRSQAFDGLNRLARFALLNVMGLLSAIREGDLDRVGFWSSKLIGLGPGSTPSGDDFLSGLMVGGITASPEGTRYRKYWKDVSQKIILSAEDRTTLVSFEYLKWASEGMGAERVIRAIEALFLGGEMDVEPATGKLLRMGSTSGVDIATGILFGCQAALEHYGFGGSLR
ncbi:MAG: DUF2877 domain-containing protein [Nitrososphaerota archaeon]|nr:DUF2877 domain-containing protein [Nitrososphaerota archaeon]